MKFHDSVIGAVLIALGLWIAWTASGFPKLTGQPIGPGPFPSFWAACVFWVGPASACKVFAIAVPSCRFIPAGAGLTGWRPPL